jgi:hypothetical protein
VSLRFVFRRINIAMYASRAMMQIPTAAPIPIPALAPTERLLSVVEAEEGAMVAEGEEDGDDEAPVCRAFPSDVGEVELAGEVEETPLDALPGVAGFAADEAELHGLLGVLLLDAAGCGVVVGFWFV